MGFDFINQAKGTIRKARERHKARLSKELVPYVEEITTILASPTLTFRFSSEQVYELQVCGSDVQVFHERTLVASATSAPKNVIDALSESGGKALGRMKKIRKHSNRVDISVLINRMGKK